MPTGNEEDDPPPPAPLALTSSRRWRCRSRPAPPASAPVIRPRASPSHHDGISAARPGRARSPLPRRAGCAASRARHRHLRARVGHAELRPSATTAPGLASPSHSQPPPCRLATGRTPPPPRPHVAALGAAAASGSRPRHRRLCARVGHAEPSLSRGHPPPQCPGRPRRATASRRLRARAGLAEPHPPAASPPAAHRRHHNRTPPRRRCADPGGGWPDPALGAPDPPPLPTSPPPRTVPVGDFVVFVPSTSHRGREHHKEKGLAAAFPARCRLCRRRAPAAARRWGGSGGTGG